MEEDNDSVEEAHARVVAEKEARHAWEVERWKDAHGADIWHMEQRHVVAVKPQTPTPQPQTPNPEP